MVSQLFYESSSDLTKAVKWVYAPEKTLVASCALRHVHLEQVESNHSAVLAYCIDDTWLYRKCKSQGVLGTEFIFDGEDLLTRVDREDVWKRSSLCLSSTKENKMNVESVIEILPEGKVKASGNILVSTYIGDRDDFQYEDTQWRELCTITEGWIFRKAASLIKNFSRLGSDTSRRSVWFRIEDNKLTLCSTEQGSDRGDSIIVYEIDHTLCENIRFGVSGKYLNKIGEVFEEFPLIKVYIEDVETPTRIKFEGDKGWIDTPIIDGYYCQALSKGAMVFFYGEGPTINNISDRIFNVIELSDRVAIQSPKKGHTLKDVVLEMLGQELIIYKRNDIHQKEMSKVSTWTIDGQGDWIPIVLDHMYLTDALDTIERHIELGIKSREGEVEFEVEDREYDEFSLGETTKKEDLALLKQKTVKLTQASFIHNNGFVSYHVFLWSTLFPECKIKLTGSTLQRTVDKVEE